MIRWYVVAWAALGAILGILGDVLILQASKPAGSRWMLALGVAVYSSCAGAWFGVGRASGGQFSEGAAVWTSATAALNVAVALVIGERQTRGQWVGFLLILAGVVVRAMTAPAGAR